MNDIWQCRYILRVGTQAIFNTYHEDTSHFNWIPFPGRWEFKDAWDCTEFYMYNKSIFDKHNSIAILIDYQNRKIAFAMTKYTLVPIQSKDRFIGRVDNDIIG